MLSKASKKFNNFEKTFLKGKTQFQKNLWHALVFLVRFNLLAIPLYLLLIYPWDPYTIQSFIAMKIAHFLNFAGISTQIVDGITFHLLGYNWYIQIIKDCIGWKSSLALFGLIFAVRKVEIGKRILGLLVGVPIIFIFNLARIFSSIYLATIFGIQNYFFIHDFLWQWGMIAVVLGVWIVWLQKMKIRD